MNKMTWLDLYIFLNQQANNLDYVGKFDWSQPVIVHDASTGDEFDADTFYISTDDENEKFVLVTNTETIYGNN